MESTLYLSTAYFPPVAYFALAARWPRVALEACESYRRQTLRNRCVVLTSQGPAALSVPVAKPASGQPIRDVRVSGHDNWPVAHWRALAAAYEKSPYYEHYIDALRPIFERRWEFLWDLNAAAARIVAAELEIPWAPALTQSYDPSPANDWRDGLGAKPADTRPGLPLAPAPYPQVFDHKFGFVAGLSILDLMFNEGPCARSVLKKMAAAGQVG